MFYGQLFSFCYRSCISGLKCNVFLRKKKTVTMLFFLSNFPHNLAGKISLLFQNQDNLLRGLAWRVGVGVEASGPSSSHAHFFEKRHLQARG